MQTAKNWVEAMDKETPDEALIPLAMEFAKEIEVDLPENFEARFRSDLGRVAAKFAVKGGFFRKVSAVPSKTLAEYPPLWVMAKLESAARAVVNAHKANDTKLSK